MPSAWQDRFQLPMATSFRKTIWSGVGGATQSETSKIIVMLWSYCSSPLRRASLRPRRRAAEPTAAAPTAAGRAAAASQQPCSCLPTLACLACIISSASARPAQIPSICPPRHPLSIQPQLRLRSSLVRSTQLNSCLPCSINSSASARPAQIPSIFPPRHPLSSQPQLRLRASPDRSALRQAALGSGLGVHARPRPSR